MRKFAVSALLALFLLTGAPALAQDTTSEVPTDAPIVTETVTPPVETPAPEMPTDELPAPIQNQFAVILENLVRLLFDGTFIPFLAAGVVVITNLLKVIFARLSIQANPVVVALVVQVAVWLVYVIATRFGYGDFFTLHWDNVIDVLRTFIPLVGGGALAHSWYEKAKDAGNPILGYQPGQTVG